MEGYGECWEKTSTYKECVCFFLVVIESKEVSRGGRQGKAGRDARPMAK